MNRPVGRHRGLSRAARARKPPRDEKLLERHESRPEVRTERQRHTKPHHAPHHVSPTAGFPAAGKCPAKKLQLIECASKAGNRASKHHRTANLPRVLSRVKAQKRRRKRKPHQPLNGFNLRQLAHPVAGCEKAGQNRAQAADRQKNRQQPQRPRRTQISNPGLRRVIAQEKQDETGNCRDDRPGFQAAPDGALHPAETPLPVFLRTEIHRRHAEACQPQRHRKAADG